MDSPTKLTPERLARTVEPGEIPFATTAELEFGAGARPIVGQERAIEALRFGVGMKNVGFNIFVIGPPGVGKRTLLLQILAEHAGRRPASSDWCYVHDFANPEHPRALELPSGQGQRLQTELTRVLVEISAAIRAAFESEEYRMRRKKISSGFQKTQERELSELRSEAGEKGVAVLQSESGMVIAPLRDGSPIETTEFQALPEEERKVFETEMEVVGERVQKLLRRFRDIGREQAEALAELDREIAASTTHRLMTHLRDRFQDLPEVVEHLETVELDIVANFRQFLANETEGVERMIKRALQHSIADGPDFLRYRVNVLADRSGDHAAPIVHEDNPTLANLLGRVEYESELGTLVTNFSLIRPGALHRALGGYLVLDALRVLSNPGAWECLKRVIRTREIKIESLSQSLGLMPTVSLEPAPIPLGDTKIMLMGEPEIYYLLAELDPDLDDLFKVLVDFDSTMERRPEAVREYARLLASLVQREGLRPFAAAAITRVIEHASRAAGDAEKLTVQMRVIVDVLREADFWAHEAGHAQVGPHDVERALRSALDRVERIPRRLREAIRRNDILVATTGESVGQINGLTVFRLGEYWFGHPTRITARVRPGKGELVDIEREVELGGPIHSKGVLILGGFLGARYATGSPLCLAASLVFEQSYTSVEGDSASLAELCALLSALSEFPIRQSFAITGSINQKGEVQSIGGVNEKIEGFFDVCQERGLSGSEGVIIPKCNVKNLMLRRDVVAAVAEDRFQVHAVGTVDEAMELLTGGSAGRRDAEGRFAVDSINGRVEARLAAFADRNRAFVTPRS